MPIRTIAGFNAQMSRQRRPVRLRPDPDSAAVGGSFMICLLDEPVYYLESGLDVASVLRATHAFMSGMEYAEMLHRMAQRRGPASRR